MDDAIKSAFDEWKIARALLSNSIQTYLDACTTFGAVCFSPRHRPLERALIEDTLIAVESELESLAADAKMLLDVQVSLKMMRNKPTATARINTLPIEVLVDIFMQSGSYCAHENSLGSRNLTGVCAYWREVALNTPDLWTHIDVGPTAPYLMSDLFLTLSKGSPIYVHLHEPQLPNDVPTPDREVGKAVGVLTPHIHRAHTLEMETYGYSRNFIFAILNLWLIRGSGDLSTVLRVFRPNGDHVLGPDGMSRYGKLDSQSKNGEAVLSSLRALHSDGVEFGWHSGAYRGLVDLRLDFSKCNSDDLSPSQFLGLLAANPELSVLKLRAPIVYTPEDQDTLAEPLTPVLLPRLKVLTIFDSSGAGLELLLSLIALPKCSSELSVGIQCSVDVCDRLKDFFVVSCRNSR